MSPIDRLTDSIEDAWDRAVDLSKDRKAVGSLAGAAVAVFGAYWLLRRSRDRKKPGTTELSGGSIEKSRVKEVFNGYSKAYSSEAGAGIIERSRTTEIVNTFYNLVTDLYEWGWGQVRLDCHTPGQLAAIKST